MKDIIELFPDNWEVKKFRQIFSFRKGLSITKEDLLEEGCPVISYGQVHSKENTGIGINQTLIRFVSEKYLYTDKISIVEPGDFIFADTSEDIDGVGNCVFVDFKSTLFAGYHTIIVHPTISECYPPYFAFLFLTDFWRANLRAKVMGVKVFSITQKLLRETFVVLPPVYEQRAIANSLHKECAHIDSIAADLEKQIALLQKYKKSLITETVTKGLDKSVPMKDSGVACIGLVPMSWGYKKLGYMADVTKLAGFEFTNYFEYVDDGVIAIRGLNLKNFDVSLADIQYIPEKISNMLPRSQVHYNDVLVSYAGTVGSVGLITDTAKRYHLAPNVGKVTVFNELIPRYLAYYLISYTGQELIDQLKNKNAQESISMENIRRIKILVPPQIEQQNICDYLDKKTDEIDTLISAQQKKLELMQAHKKSLIYEYVTGKKRVKEVR